VSYAWLALWAGITWNVNCEIAVALMSEVVNPNQTRDEQVLRDIASLNFQFLILLREVGQKSVVQAERQFGVSDSFVEKVIELDRAEIARLATMPACIFSPRCSETLCIAALEATSDEDGARLDALQQLMTAI